MFFSGHLGEPGRCALFKMHQLCQLGKGLTFSFFKPFPSVLTINIGFISRFFNFFRFCFFWAYFYMFIIELLVGFFTIKHN